VPRRRSRPPNAVVSGRFSRVTTGAESPRRRMRTPAWTEIASEAGAARLSAGSSRAASVLLACSTRIGALRAVPYVGPMRARSFGSAPSASASVVAAARANGPGCIQREGDRVFEGQPRTLGDGAIPASSPIACERGRRRSRRASRRWRPAAGRSDGQRQRRTAVPPARVRRAGMRSRRGRSGPRRDGQVELLAARLCVRQLAGVSTPGAGTDA
jgi:hypothetical protein